MRKRRGIRKSEFRAVRLDPYEAQILDDIAGEMGNRSVALRCALLTLRVLFDPNLTLADALKPEVLEKLRKDIKSANYISFGDAIKSPIVLAKELNLAPVYERLEKVLSKLKH